MILLFTLLYAEEVLSEEGLRDPNNIVPTEEDIQGLPHNEEPYLDQEAVPGGLDDPQRNVSTSSSVPTSRKLNEYYEKQPKVVEKILKKRKKPYKKHRASSSKKLSNHHPKKRTETITVKAKSKKGKKRKLSSD